MLMVITFKFKIIAKMVKINLKNNYKVDNVEILETVKNK